MYPSKLHLNDIPRGVRLPFSRKKSYFLLKLYRLKSSDGATKAGIGNAEFSCPLTNRRKALIYIDLFNIKQASGTDPYAVPGTRYPVRALLTHTAPTSSQR
jgi:hypothetical protein